MQNIRNILHKIKAGLPFIFLLLALVYCFKPLHAVAFDTDWDGGHITTDVESPDPPTPPGDDTGGDGGDGDDYGDGGDGDDDNEPEPPDEDEDDPDEEDKDDDCEEDCNNECKPDAKKSPVYVKSGNLELKYTDFEIGGIGPPLNVIRSYNSQDRYNGPFGNGWSFNLLVRLIRVADATGDYVIIRKPSGKRLEFVKYPDGTYWPTAASVTDTLTEEQDGTFTLNCKSCSRTHNRPSYHFNANGNLIYMSDHNGRRLNFTYDPDGRLVSVASTATSRSLTISYGSNEKISRIRINRGPAWNYAYDKNDNLITVTDPLGYSLDYEYDVKNKLLSVTDKNGNQAPVITYDEKIRVKTYGRGKEIYTYTYFPAQGYTRKTDPLGNTFTYYYDHNGNVTKTVLPDGSEVLTYIDQNVRPVKRVNASGNEWQYTYNSAGQVLTATDPLGHVTTYTYDPVFGKIASMTDPRGAIWTYAYDSSGNLIKTVDPLGCETTMTYDADGFMLTKTDPGGNTFTYTYDAARNLVKIADLLGTVETATYDVLGNQLTKTDARGNTWIYTYDLMDRLTTVTDPDGNKKTFTYDGNGNKIRVTDENGHATTYAYDVSNQMISQTDPLGNTTAYVYNAAGHLLSVTDPMGGTHSRTYNNRYHIISETDAENNTTTFTYDDSGNRLTKTDPRDNTWTYTYDAMDQILTETDPLGNTFSYEYDETGNRTKQIDPEGKVTYFTYDLTGNLTRTLVKVGDTDPEPDEDDIVIFFEYDCMGRRISETDALGQKTTRTYDVRGNLLTETNSLGEVKTYTYDETNNKLTYKTVTGNVITYTYDKLNRMISAGDTTGTFETYAYDGVGNRTKTTNAAGNVTTTTYTPFNKPAKVTDGRGNDTTFTYDNNYNLLTVVDRMGNTTVNTYDKLNRLIQVVDPLGETSALAFDKAGNMVKMTDANEKETQYTYDAANQLISITYADGTTKAVTYNGAGKIIRKTDQNGAVIDYERDDLYRIVQRKYPDTSTYDYTYDKLGRLKTATNDYGTVSFTYDAAGRITEIDQNGTKITYDHDVTSRTRTVHYPGGKTVMETYSLRDKISTIDEIDDADNAVTIAAYTYDALSRPLTKVFGNGVTTGYAYNPNSRITEIAYQKADGSALLGFQYGYDKEGNRIHTLDTARPARSEQYAFDDNQRLTVFKQGTADPDNQIPTPQFKAEYELDPLGNFLKVTRDGTAETRSVNAMNQYTKVGSTDLQYDAYGNLIDDGKQIYQYDYENQLIKITSKSNPADVVSFTIDALNRRVKKTVGNVSTEYIYDDSRIIEERVANDVRASYVYGNGLDEVIQMERDGVAVYFLTDVIGSVMALTDAGGNVTETYQYDAYGRVTFYNAAGTKINTSAEENPYLFTGRRYDAESGIYYYRARCYHPDLGRFLNPDPKGFIDGLNLYEYAMSNPLRYTDPRGTVAQECDAHSLTFDADKIKNMIPKFLSKYMNSGSIGVSYKKCKVCCGEGTKHAGQYVTNKELGVTAGWSGDSGYINTPWGISWDIDVWVFQSKGFIGLVAKITWGLSGSLSGGYDNCIEKGFGKGCIAGSLTLEALFGLAEENKDSSLIKAYVSGGVTGKIEVCLVVAGASLNVELGAGLSGAIKGTVGIWKFTYERTFYEISGSLGPLKLLSL